MRRLMIAVIFQLWNSNCCKKWFCFIYEKEALSGCVIDTMHLLTFYFPNVIGLPLSVVKCRGGAHHLVPTPTAARVLATQTIYRVVLATQTIYRIVLLRLLLRLQPGHLGLSTA